MRRITSSTICAIRVGVLISLLVVVPGGFLAKLYSGPAQSWFNNYGAGVLYEVFWCLVFLFLWPRKEAITRIVVGVLLVTCLLEVLQLWHPRILEQVRATFLGRTLIGTTFTWWDFPHYVLGCAIGWLWLRSLVEACEKRGRP